MLHRTRTIIALLFVFPTCEMAFVSRTPMVKALFPGTSCSMSDDEWYCPPPLSKQAGLQLPPPGIKVNEIAVTSILQWDELLATQDDRLMVVKFHVPWCKACQQFSLKYDGLMITQADWVSRQNKNLVKVGVAHFVSIECSSRINRELCQREQVDKFPTVRFYRHGKLLQEITPNAMLFQRVADALSYHLRYHSQKTTTHLETILDRGTTLIENMVRGNMNDLYPASRS